MPIQYGEIIINVENETVYNYFNKIIGNDITFDKKDIIIISFNDGTNIQSTNLTTSNTFDMGIIGFNSILPLYFSIGPTLFLIQTPVYENRVKSMDFKPIFSKYPDYLTIEKIASMYNVIYQINKVDVFAIIKISSSSNNNNNNHRFLLAYDDSYFKRAEIAHFIEHIFKDNFNNYKDKNV